MGAVINSVSLKPINNILVYPSIDGSGWSKGYQKNIQFSDDGPNPLSPKVATFNDAEPNNSQGYWYSYGDYAPQEPNTTYIVKLWAKVDEGYADINFYTADNEENSQHGPNARYWSPAQRVTAAEGWKLLTWEFTTPPIWYSDSLSFQWSGTWGANNLKMSISAPEMYPKTDFNFVYSQHLVKIEVDVTFKAIKFEDMENTTWDSYDDINTWDDIESI